MAKSGDASSSSSSVGDAGGEATKCHEDEDEDEEEKPAAESEPTTPRLRVDEAEVATQAAGINAFAVVAAVVVDDADVFGDANSKCAATSG